MLKGRTLSRMSACNESEHGLSAEQHASAVLSIADCSSALASSRFGSITARLDSSPADQHNNSRRPHLGATKGAHHLPPFTFDYVI